MRSWRLTLGDADFQLVTRRNRRASMALFSCALGEMFLSDLVHSHEFFHTFRSHHQTRHRWQDNVFAMQWQDSCSVRRRSLSYGCEKDPTSEVRDFVICAYVQNCTYYGFFEGPCHCHCRCSLFCSLLFLMWNKRVLDIRWILKKPELRQRSKLNEFVSCRNVLTHAMWKWGVRESWNLLLSVPTLRGQLQRGPWQISGHQSRYSKDRRRQFDHTNKLII